MSVESRKLVTTVNHLNIILEVNLRPLSCVESILIAIKTARIKASTVPVLTKSKSLRTRTIRILDVHIIHLEIVFVNTQCGTGVVRPCLTGWDTRLNSDLVFGIGGNAS